jgi:hypothetical protein
MSGMMVKEVIESTTRQNLGDDRLEKWRLG